MKTTSTHSNERANAGSDEFSSHGQTGAQPIRIDYNARYVNRQLPTKQLLDLLEDAAPDLFYRAEVIGAWVWIQFPDKQPREVTARLAEFGFHWNNKHQVWQHPCGKETQTPFDGDPRERYGSTFPSQTAN
jgi:hypothetical protein